MEAVAEINFCDSFFLKFLRRIIRIYGILNLNISAEVS